MAEWIERIIEAGFIFCICYAIISDMRSWRIPNWISLSLFALFVGHVLVTGRTADLPGHIVVAGIVLAVTFALFARNIIGGGDAKLLPALAFWAGPEHIGLLLIYIALGGGAIALALLALKAGVRAAPDLEHHPLLAMPMSWLRAGCLPYALPMGCAALMLAPTIV
jgi:prepilin peptidase CpaA